MNRFNFVDQNPVPKPLVAIIENVDMTVVENLDLFLPVNFRYKLKAVSVISRTVNTLTVGATLAVQDWDGASNVETKSTAAALANTAVADTAQDLAILAPIKIVRGGHWLRIAKTVGATATAHTADIVIEFVSLT